MHYSPMATEKFDVVPGESDLSSEAADALLLSDILLEVPGGKIEVHSLEVMNQIKSFLTGVTFTKEMVTFFNAKFSFDSDGDSDGDSECTAVYVGENHDAFDALPDVPDTAPGTSRDGLPVPDVLPGASSEASRGIIPNVLPDDPGVPPVGLGVFGMPGALPDVLADALSVPETQTHYDDVIVGQTGPFNLSDLQDIREDEQED